MYLVHPQEVLGGKQGALYCSFVKMVNERVVFSLENVSNELFNK